MKAIVDFLLPPETCCDTIDYATRRQGELGHQQ